MSLELHRSIVLDHVERLSEKLGRPAAPMFLGLVWGLATRSGFDSLDDEDITDGGDDFEIDVFSIDESELHANVTLIAGTLSKSHSTREITNFGAGLEYALLASKKDYSALSNDRLRSRIADFREVRTRLGTGQVAINAVFASLGDASKLSRPFQSEVERVRQRFAGAGIPITLHILGAAELASLLEELQSHQRKVSARLSIEYDVNTPSVIRRSISGADGLVCSVPAIEIAKLVANHHTVFDRNLRQFLGGANPVNKAIHETCTSATSASLFWFLNNGITIICDSFDYTPATEGAFVDLKNLQIVNGCQTSSVLRDALLEHALQPGTTVLVRIFRSATPALAERVVVTTNTQTRVSGRDLRANDPIQSSLQTAFRDQFGLLYERKPNEFLNIAEIERSKVISNERIGQAYMALVMRRPADAARRKGKLWDANSSHVFNSDVHPITYLLAYRFVESCRNWRAEYFAVYPDRRKDDRYQRLLRSGIYHVARVACYCWRRGDEWGTPASQRLELSALESGSVALHDLCGASLDMLMDEIQRDDVFDADLGLALKSGDLEKRIDRRLYDPKFIKSLNSDETRSGSGSRSAARGSRSKPDRKRAKSGRG